MRLTGRVAHTMPFASIFGHNRAVCALQKALAEDMLVGAYLLVGPPGVGKTTLALAFAEAAACLHPHSDPFDACGECDSCRRARANAHPEITLIPPAGEQTQIWQFWDRDGRPPGILQHTLPFAPTIGRRRVYILERAETLNIAAANSLLKVLEEPPPYALFLLLAPHPDRLLPTILSRVQLVRLLPAPVNDLAAYLVKSVGLSPERARTLAVYAEGRTGTALGLARNVIAEEEIARLLELAETIPDSSPLRALQIAEAMRKIASGLKGLINTEQAGAESGQEAGNGPEEGTPDEESSEPPSKERIGRRQLAIVIELLTAFYRDLLSLSLYGEEATIVHSDRRAHLAALATHRSPQTWMACLETLMLARKRLDQNVSVPLLTDWLATQLVLSAET
ncbi:MAG TPA: hypothetical protein VNJ09_05210 [Chthonomonadales bacterium]|nr:hypothetical protein [Chthonomonadales bacterium]